MVSSRGHHFGPVRFEDLNFERGYDKWLAYGQAKTANVLFAVQLDKLARDHGVRAFALHPGRILTPLVRHLSHEELVDWAATSPQLDGLGGVYLEDCDVAEPALADGTRTGVKDYAVDPAQAERLWTVSAELTGVNAF